MTTDEVLERIRQADALLAAKLEVRPSGCIEWTGALNDMGYGNIGRGGRTFHTHRYAYTLIIGPVPEGLVLDHLCGNRCCVNVAHLEPVTQAVNVRRAPTGNAAKESCPAGHPYSADNTYRWQGNQGRQGNFRRCRECNNESQRRRRAGRAQARA